MRRLLATAVLILAAGGLTACVPAAAPAYDPGPPWTASWATILIHADPFLVCVRRHESDRGDYNKNGLHDGGYQALNGSGSGAAGAYQFLQGTWNTQAHAIGRDDLVGRHPNTVGIVDQDLVAWTLSVGTHAPWAGSGC